MKFESLNVVAIEFLLTLLPAMNGANLGVAIDFNIHYEKTDARRNTSDLWLIGLLNAIPFLAGGLL